MNWPRLPAAEVKIPPAIPPQEVAQPAVSPKAESKWVFSLMPKSLQRRPRLDFNIITTLTPLGKERPAPTPEQPAFFVAQAGINRNFGVGAEEGLKTPPPAELRGMIERALAENGYRPASEATSPPTLVIFYHWGSSTFNPTEFDAELTRRKTLLDRAMLLAGESFAQEVSRAMEETDRISHMHPDIAAMMPNPMDTLSNRSPEMTRLVEELFSSSYFVVASAFDYAEMAKGRGMLLWRTKMTVNSLGVNMTESLPPLIASAGPYFGRDMAEPVVVAKRISREGKVEMGTPTVVEEPSPKK